MYLFACWSINKFHNPMNLDTFAKTPSVFASCARLIRRHHPEPPGRGKTNTCRHANRAAASTSHLHRYFPAPQTKPCSTNNKHNLFFRVSWGTDGWSTSSGTYLVIVGLLGLTIQSESLTIFHDHVGNTYRNPFKNGKSYN